MTSSLVDDYARLLAKLEGEAFETEVCNRLAGAIAGFQSIPALPNGDGGLDGLSNDWTHGYCCYGPEYKAAKSGKDRVNDIVSKFTADLRRLFELQTEGKKLVHAENKELAEILPPGRKLVVIKLLVNWFENNRIIGRIGKVVDECKKSSKCRFVDPGVEVVVLGPNQLANRYPVDELTMARVGQYAFVERVESRRVSVDPDDTTTFDKKMADLDDIVPDQKHAIARLATDLRDDWRKSLAFERELGDTAPRLHQLLETGRKRLATRITSLMIGATEPWAQLDRALDIARQSLDSDFGSLYGSFVGSIANGEVARLIGECPIAWKKRSGDAL